MPMNKIMIEGVRIPGVNFGSSIFVHLNEDILEQSIVESIEKYKDMHPMQGPVGMWRRNGAQSEFARIFTVWGDEIFYKQIVFNTYVWLKDDKCKFGCVSEFDIMGLISNPANAKFDHSSIMVSNKISRCWFEGQDTLFPKRVPYHLWWNPLTLGVTDDGETIEDNRANNVYGKRIWIY